MKPRVITDSIRYESTTRRGEEGRDLYWLRSEVMAATAACLTWGGAGKSGKPSARLMAPHRWERWESSWMGEGRRARDALESFASISLMAGAFLPHGFADQVPMKLTVISFNKRAWAWAPATRPGLTHSEWLNSKRAHGYARG